MKRMLAVAAVLVITSCSKKKDDNATPPADPPKGSAAVEAPKQEPKKEEPKSDEKKLPEVEMVEHDLSPFGKQFAGWVVTAPKDAKITFDDPSRHITLSDEDFVAISEAPGWKDANNEKSLASDKDNQNIKIVSDTEVRYERTPPLGKSWCVDVLVKVGKDQFSCGTGMTCTFHSAAMADRISTICKSIKKK
jgi:hypothetical protein